MEPSAESKNTQLFKEENSDDAVFNIYLKKVRYHTVSDVPNLALWSPTEDKKGHLQWRLEEHRVIKVGTLQRLVEAICTASGELDSTYVNMLLATYRTFTTPFCLMTEVIKRYKDVNDVKMPQSVREACTGSIRAMILVWLDLYDDDFKESPGYPTLTALKTFASSTSADGELLERAVEKLEAFRKNDDQLDCSLCESVQVQDLAVALRNSVLDTARKTCRRGKDGLVPPVDLLSIPEKVFAEQLTYIDAELFKRVVPHHCIGSVWARRADKRCDAQPLTVYATVDQFNAVSYRVIATVLKEPSGAIADRAAVIEKWIQIAQECRILKNFSSLKAIIAGLQSTSVFRLTKVWQRVSREKVTVYEELSDIFSEENNQSILRELLIREGTAKCATPEANATLRLAVKLKTPTLRSRKAYNFDIPSNSTMQGTVPYLGTFLTDLTMIDTAFKDFLQGGLINFDKKRREFEVLAQIRLLQSTASLYRIKPDIVFFDWFYRLRIYDENESYELSHEVEPSNKYATMERRGHTKNASLGFFSPPRPAVSLEDLRYLNPQSGSSASLSGLDKEDGDSRSMMEFSLTPDNRPPYRQMLSMTSVKSMSDLPTEMSPLSCHFNGRDETIAVKVFLQVSENHHTNNYKTVLVSHNEHANAVLRNILIKYGVIGRPDDFRINQLLPNSTELELPARGNVFYAVKKDVPDVRFIVRRRLDHEKEKRKAGVKQRPRLSRLIF